MNERLLQLHVWCTLHLLDALPIGRDRRPGERDDAGSVRDRGQATTEYALVMLGAAVIALLVVTWATSGGGAGKIGKLFDRVVDAVTDKI